LKALIIAAPGVQDVELVYPYYRLQEAGYAVSVAAAVEPREKAFQGIGGLWLPAHRDLPVEGERHPDLLVLPGGVKAMEKLRQEKGLLCFIREVHAAGKVIASMCSGAQLLISAGIVKGRTISAYPAMRVDVENAGAKFHEGPVCVDGNIVSAPHYDHLGPWMAYVLERTEREHALSSLEGKTWTGTKEEIAQDIAKWRESAACAAAL
jgi:protease I